jgi:hypothetical protein
MKRIENISAILSLIIISTACATNPILPEIMDGRNIWKADIGKTISFAIQREGKDTTLLNLGVDYRNGNLHLFEPSGGEWSTKVERNLYVSDLRPVYGFFGRITGDVHLLFAVNLPEFTPIGDFWTGKLYGDNSAIYQLVGTELFIDDLGNSIPVYRVEMTIHWIDEDPGQGYALVNPDFGIVFLEYSSNSQGNLKMSRLFNTTTIELLGGIDSSGSGRDETRFPAAIYSIFPQPDTEGVYLDANMAISSRKAFQLDTLETYRNAIKIDPPVQADAYLGWFLEENTALILELEDLQPETEYRIEIDFNILLGEDQSHEIFTMNFTTGIKREFDTPISNIRPIILSPPHLGNKPSFVLEWEPVEGAAYYEIQVSTGEAMIDYIAQFENEGTSLGMAMDTPNQYYLRVRARLENGFSNWSKIYFVDTTD